MKTQSNFSGSFDDLVFENRNKLYGAYALRSNYNISLIKALTISSLLAGLVLFLATRQWTQEQIAIAANTAKETVIDIVDPETYKPKEDPKPELPQSKSTAAIRAEDTYSVDGKETKETDKRIINVGPINRDGENKKDENIDDFIDPTETGGGGITKKPELTNSNPKNLAEVEEMPEFPGGPAAMSKFLNNYLQRDDTWKDMGLSGSVSVQFIIDNQGTVTSVKAIAGPYELLKKTSERAIKAMPKWKPGRQQGHDVAVILSLPINFVITQ